MQELNYARFYRDNWTYRKKIKSIDIFSVAFYFDTYWRTLHAAT